VDTTASPRIHLLALIALLAGLALAGGFFFMSRGQSGADAAPLPPPAVIKPKPKPAATVNAAVAVKAAAAAKRKAAAAAVAAAQAKPVAPAKPKPVVKAKPKPAVKAKPKPAVKAKPKPRRSVIAPNGLPTALVEQLARYRVVVAAVYAGGAAVDTLARAEARAGAGDAKVGFVALDVSNKRIATALANKTELLTAPAVLVFTRGGNVKIRIDGFADRLLVAELATSKA
jgi:hypothetical protein